MILLQKNQINQISKHAFIERRECSIFISKTQKERKHRYILIFDGVCFYIHHFYCLHQHYLYYYLFFLFFLL